MNRFYTWLDVQATLEAANLGPAPQGVNSFEYFFDSLVVGVDCLQDTSVARNYLKAVFGDRFHDDMIILDGNHTKTLSVFYETDITSASTRPLFARTDLRLFPARLLMPPPLPENAPPLVAFHSFKGGVGRTTHLLAFLRAALDVDENLRTLVVDADLEAPGITWLLSGDRFGVPEVSLIDCLALWHSDSTPDRTDSLRSIVERLQSQSMSTTGYRAETFYLPAFRYPEQLLTSYILPEQLIAPPGEEWSFAFLLCRLAINLKCDLVLVDLRAGMSEIASPLLFDQRIYRALVSTSAPQSVKGTSVILRLMRQHSSDGLKRNPPEIILSFSTPDLQAAGTYAIAEEELISQLPIGADAAAGEFANPISVEISDTPFVASLQYVATISELFQRAKEGGLTDALRSFAERVLSGSGGAIETEAQTLTLIEERRERLALLAKSYEYAESGSSADFLKTPQLRALAQTFNGAGPQLVVLGAKGSGKTYTYLQIARQEHWSMFASEYSSDANSCSFVWPALRSLSLSGEALKTIRDCIDLTARVAHLNADETTIAVARERLLRRLGEHKGSIIAQRDDWFRFFSESLGLIVESSEDPARELFAKLQNVGAHLVLIIDGLEDTFQDVNVSPDERTAVRALLQEVMSRIQSTPDAPLGIVTFVRTDIARTAITQNFGQFTKQYERFELRWNHEQALRLVYWLFTKATAVDGSITSAVDKEPTELDLRQLLIPLWGSKLGSMKSREARTAEWIIAALSDFNGRIQARDLVRLIRYATELTLEQAAPPQDRLLSANAIRLSVTKCSTEKIKEIEEEVGELKALFEKLRNNSDRKIPLDAVDLGLSRNEVDFLTSNGVLLEDQGSYYMPEIFRLGLDYRLELGARPRVLTMARRFSRTLTT